MNGTIKNLRLFTADPAGPSAEVPALPALPPEPTALANRELLRPPTYGRGHHHLEPYSAAWFDELGRKRYARHGRWLPAALEFGRHPGESILLIGPGVGCDAARYLEHGCEVTVAATAADHPDVVRTNLARRGLAADVVTVAGPPYPFPAGTFDVVVLNALHAPGPVTPAAADEIGRVLKAGGKLIGLFPARLDAGYWQDLLLPLQRYYWHRPPDPTAGPKTTRKELAGVFARFGDHRVRKRHLRRSELPHPWRVLPLVVLERLIGRVLVFKAFKPLHAARPAAAGARTHDQLAA